MIIAGNLLSSLWLHWLGSLGTLRHLLQTLEAQEVPGKRYVCGIRLEEEEVRLDSYKKSVYLDPNLFKRSIIWMIARFDF